MYLEHHLGYEDNAVTLGVLKSGYLCYSDGSRLARDDIYRWEKEGGKVKNRV